ncbi:terminase TerL endonuclease subunit [Amycolatopsis japonica]
MPRTLVRAPAHDRTRSLGWLALAWIEFFYVHGPGDVQGQPVRHGDEYAGFIVDCYALDEPGKLLYDSGFFSRPKGTNKSGLAAEFCLFEALGPCRFAGYAEGGEVYEDPWGFGFRYEYVAGEPMGRPVQTPFIRVMATEEEQTGNVFDNVHYNLTEGPLADVPGIDPGLTRVNLPGGGEITPSTASSASKDGGKETFVVFDESHLYNTPELRRMYKTVTRNLRKRKKFAGTWYLETTTMFAPGEESIAETTYEQAEAILERRVRGRSRSLFDHRWGECADVTAEADLRAAILEAFGEAIEWNDIDGIVDEFYTLLADEADSRRYFLNAKTSVVDAWVPEKAWTDCGAPEKRLQPGDVITLGFDGSVRDDSTALAACRVSDGHVQLLEHDGWPTCWEKPPGPEGEGWQVDREAVNAAVAWAFTTYKVVGFYCDPPHWQDYVDAWSAEFADQLEVKGTQGRPLEWWTNRPLVMSRSLERFHEAVLEGDLTHDGGTVLKRHVLNARRRKTRSGDVIMKEHPKSMRKIDAAMAATLAYECRADAIALGVDGVEEPSEAYSFNV